MWYWIIAIIVAFITFSIMYAYCAKYQIRSYLDYYEGLGVFGPTLSGLFWPIFLIGGLCYLIYKKWIKKHYYKFVRWLGDKLFPNI